MKALSIRCLPFAVALLIPPFPTGARPNSGVRIDPGFQTAIQGSVSAIVVQEDGTIIVGGMFGQVNGTVRSNLAKLSDDGGLDLAFAPKADGAVTALEELGRDLAVGGRFSHISGIFAPNLAVMDASGQIQWGGTQGGVACLAASGDLWAGGNFQSIQGRERFYAARWSMHGELNLAFVPALRPSRAIEAGASAMAVQADGKLVVAGVFETEKGMGPLVRLNEDGTLDSSFGGDCGSVLYVRAIKILDQGQLLVGGLDRHGKGFVRRLNADRSMDPGFAAPDLGGPVHALALDASRRIVAGGAFGLARFLANGSPDPDWSAPVSGVVNALSIDDQKRILAGGYLRTEMGHTGLVRLLDGGTINPLTTNGGFRAALKAQAGRTYAVEASSDLRIWEEISTAVATEAGVEVLDESASGRRHRFFRARLVQ